MTKTLRKVLLWIASAFMFLSMIGLVAVMPETRKVFAEEPAWKTGVFEMENGASLKLGEIGGLRFVVRMDEEVYDFIKDNDGVELGFVIAPKNLMLAANGDYLNMPKKIGGAADKNKIYQEGNYYFANGCISNIMSANLTRSFTAIAYIKYGEEVRYTDYNDLARNNLYDVVNMAVLSGNYTKELFGEKAGGYVQNGENVGWYGSEEYPIVVENTTEYTALVETINENSDINFSSYHVVVENEATTDKVFGNTETAPTIGSGALFTFNKQITALPDSVTMPDAIGQIPRIREVEKLYNALTETDKAKVGVAAVAKLTSLLQSIEGYDRVYKHDDNDGTAAPAALHNSAPSIGVTGTTRQDNVEGNILTVTPEKGGKAGLHFKNFPNVSDYQTIYFKARIVNGSGYLYMADGVTNDGWGDTWKNNSGSYSNYAFGTNFKLFAVDVSAGYIGNDFALTIWGSGKQDIAFEITDIFGIRKDKLERAEQSTELKFGSFSDSGTTNEHGKVYNFTQGWSDPRALGSFGTGALKNVLASGHNALHFWMYNPNASDLSCWVSEAVGWSRVGELGVLKAQAWTEVVLSPDVIALNQMYTLCINVDSGAGTKGWQISKIFSFHNGEEVIKQKAPISFGVQTDAGTSNVFGQVYNISREQWLIDANNVNTIGALQKGKLANALPAGYESFYLWMYNPTDTVYTFHLAGDVSGNWTDSKDFFNLIPKVWTKITISAEDIELNKQGGWYVYILGGDGAGAAKDGWQISTIYAGPEVVEKIEISYTDHADVKEIISLINALPQTPTVADKAAVEAARAGYNSLTAKQQALVNNLSKLTEAETAIQDLEEASEVVALINAINPDDVNETAVANARAAYNALSDTAKTYVTNLAKLAAYETELTNKAAAERVIAMINGLPEIMQMPQHVGYLSKVHATKAAYEALSDEVKELVTNYARLKRAITACQGYEVVVEMNESTVKAVPGHSPNKPSTIQPTGSFYTDETYGQVFRATSGAGGRVSIQFINFPSLAEYTNVYLLVKGIGVYGNLYVSYDTGEGGWASNWVNNYKQIEAGTCTYNVVNNAWSVIELDLTSNVFSPNWAMCVWSNATDETLEIAGIIGVKMNLGEKSNLTFGNMTDSGTVNPYGTVNNLTQAWGDNYAFGAFNSGALRGYLTSGCDSYQFWVYNPNDSDASFYFNEDQTWKQTILGTAKAKDWSKIVITPELIQANEMYLQYVCVTAGVKTPGWQISPLYCFSSTATSQDNVDLVQAIMDVLNTTNIDEAKVTAARTAYEALSESEKELVDITNLITCEKALYGNCNTQAFIVNGETNYKIYYEIGLRSVASFMQGQLETTTGATLKLVSATPNTITEDRYRYAIVFGHEDLAARLGVQLPSDAGIGTAGYIIKKVGRTVFILANGEDGYRMGVLAFLRETIGYEMIAEDCVIYNKEGAEVLPEFNLVETPSFGYRQQQTYMTETEVKNMGLQTHGDLWIPSPEDWDMHNTLHYLPVATYQAAHPSWYYTYTDSISEQRTQICPTAGGKSSEFNAMVEAIAANMLVQINAYPERENISFSIMDTADKDDCQCTRCKLYDTLYGEGGFAAAWIDLMNAINAKVRESLPAGRVLNIAFLAYRGTEKAPAYNDLSLMKRYEIDDNGNYTQTNEYLKCDKGVTVWLAPINAVYAENFNHADNAEHLLTVKKWLALSDSVYVWMYGTNFKFYMYPYNSWQASAETYKIFHDLGVKAVWSQSNETEATAFTDLKGYIDSKFMFNVNADYETVLDSYFDGYFGPASATMRSLFDKYVAQCNAIEANNNGLGRGIYDAIGNTLFKKYWSKTWVDECVALCDQAKADVDADTSLTDAQKTAIKNRITKESLFPRYLLCTTFASSYTTANKKALRQAFKADCEAFGITLYCEAGGDLSNLYSDWGV